MKVLKSFLFLSLSLVTALSAADYQLTPILKDGIEDPIFIAPVPGEAGAYWIAEQAGRIRRFANGRLETKPVMDISSRVRSRGDPCA